MTAVDMAQFIIARSDQLNADDLITGPQTITVTKVSASPDSAEQPVSVHYEGDKGKPFKPCKSMRRVLAHVWGREGSAYVGKSMTVYRDDKVAFGGIQVGGIRISHMSHIDESTSVALMITRGKRAPYVVKPLRQERGHQGERRDAPRDDRQVGLTSRDSTAQTRTDDDFPGDRQGAFDAPAWASDLNRNMDQFEELVDLNTFTDDPDNIAKFEALQNASPGLARSLEAAINGRRKALTAKASG